MVQHMVGNTYGFTYHIFALPFFFFLKRHTIYTIFSAAAQASHGSVRAGTHPFKLELLTEYTDVAVDGWRPGLNYDFQLSTPSKIDTGIGGYLILVRLTFTALKNL